ncbi:MAG: hypothetical protein CFE26_17395 [Verrucomicrobiales bacterium VVV1]|nr:MAG: hypothetical protein CFE26_17395 [Verrucomicrobiales bacterium VVV1]
MKAILVLMFGLGVVLGYWRTADDSLNPGSRPQRSDTRSSRLLPGSMESSSDPSSRRADTLSPDLHKRLGELVESGASTALSADQFFTRDGNHPQPGFEKLCEWATLDGKEKAALSRLLKECADDRRRWEKMNVKVKLVAPGKWTLEFPGDQGQAKRDLMMRLQEAFDPETAEAIEAGGDLENFFGFERWAPEFTHGVVTVITSRKSDGATDPQGQTLCIEGRYENHAFAGQAKVDTYMNEAMNDRLTGLLGSHQEVLDQASEASRGPAAR